MESTVLQIEAYNSQDLESFLDCYTDDIKVYMLESNQLLTDGIQQLSETMKTAFVSNPESNSNILSTLTQGNLIVQKEEITGHIENKMIKTISIYEITDNKISKIWFGGRTVE
ncbi:MAG: nuclear transport factor 2 family protein [Candidatus Kariarchaeaceae archaeon]|jgi:hypothetical protein